MGEYTGFLKEITDQRIKDLVNELKRYDEFDDKIFIITSDHGHTGMPHPIYYKDPKDGQQKEADTSCEFNIKNFNKKNTQNKEKYNNNLHIWELANLLGVISQGQGLRDRGIVYKLLVPNEISKSIESTIPEAYRPVSDINQANVIAALNGPMAHIYYRDGNSWSNVPGEVELTQLAVVLREILQTGGGNLDEDTREKFSRLVSSVDLILIRIGGQYYVFNGVIVDGEGNIVGADKIPIDTYNFDSTKYVDAVNRINAMNNEKRSGDIVLLFKFDTDGSVSDRYTSGVSCRSWHGSLNKSDSYVPFIVAYPGGNKYEIEAILKRDNVCKPDYSGCKGNWK
jgi:hypothetical protein